MKEKCTVSSETHIVDFFMENYICGMKKLQVC